MDLSAQKTVRRDVDTVWKGLWNIEDVARCIEGCREVEVLEAQKRYAATVVERVGPFSVSLKMELDVEADEKIRKLSIEARGIDGKLGTRVRWNADVGLQAAGEDATEMDIQLHAEIRGKIASLGEGVVKRKAREGLDKFTQAFSAMLESGA